MLAPRVLLVLLLGAAVHGRPSDDGGRPVDEPMRQVFDLTAEAGAPAFLVLQLPRGYWRRTFLDGWGKPRTTLPRGGEFKRVPSPDTPNENGGVTVEYVAAEGHSLDGAVESVYRTWVKNGRNVSPEPEEHKRRSVKVRNAKLKAVVWRWSSEHTMTGQAITTTSAACEVNGAIVVLTGWELEGLGGVRQRRGHVDRPGRPRVRNFSTAGIFEDLLRATSVVDQRPKPQPVRFKVSDTYSNGRYYLTGLLPAGFEQGGGPFPAGSAACAFRRDPGTGEVQARFRMAMWTPQDGNLEAEVERVLATVREKHKDVAEPRPVAAGSVRGVLLGFRDETESDGMGPRTVRTALFFAGGRIWMWSYLSTEEGERLERDLAAFEELTLKSARIWWRK